MATTNRMAANVNGGRSCSPSFMTSQVEPHMTLSNNQTRSGLVIWSLLPIEPLELVLRSWGSQCKLSYCKVLGHYVGLGNLQFPHLFRRARWGFV